MITIYDPNQHIIRTITRDRERERRNPQQSALLQVDARVKREQQRTRPDRYTKRQRPDGRMG
jgi:hypothetical protein